MVQRQEELKVLYPETKWIYTCAPDIWTWHYKPMSSEQYFTHSAGHGICWTGDAHNSTSCISSSSNHSANDSKRSMGHKWNNTIGSSTCHLQVWCLKYSLATCGEQRNRNNSVAIFTVQTYHLLHLQTTSTAKYWSKIAWFLWCPSVIDNDSLGSVFIMEKLFDRQAVAYLNCKWEDNDHSYCVRQFTLHRPNTQNDTHDCPRHLQREEPPESAPHANSATNIVRHTTACGSQSVSKSSHNESKHSHWASSVFYFHARNRRLLLMQEFVGIQQCRPNLQNMQTLLDLSWELQKSGKPFCD